MKKLFIMSLLLISFSANAGTILKYETKCIAGYVFAIVMTRESNNKPVSVSMVQIFEIAAGNSTVNNPQPMRCK